MLGRLTSTPSGTRGSYFLVTVLVEATSPPFAAIVCRQGYNSLLRRAPLRIEVGAGSSDDVGAGRGTAGQREPGPGFFVSGRVDDDARLRQVRDVEFGGREAQHPGLRVQVGKRARLRVGDVVPRPQVGELAAHAGQAADVLFPVRVADVTAVRGAQPRHHVAALLVVV